MYKIVKIPLRLDAVYLDAKMSASGFLVGLSGESGLFNGGNLSALFWGQVA